MNERLCLSRLGFRKAEHGRPARDRADALYGCAMRIRLGTRSGLAAIGLSCLAFAPARADVRAFDIAELPGSGRIVAAEFADLDGDGRTDLFSVSLDGVPPNERRELQVRFQREDGSLLAQPDIRSSAVAGAAAFDVADLPDGPGQEILLLRGPGVSVLSFANRELKQREIGVPNRLTLGTSPDERGLDRLRMARTGIGPNIRLLVPLHGQCAIFEPDGSLVALLEVGHRANYFIPPRPGPLIGENEIEQYYDFPRLDVGDVDGDGRGDVIASNRHEVRAFLQRPDGSFDSQPDLRLTLGRLTVEDQIRGTSNVRVLPVDFNGDGAIDLLVTYTTGGFLNAKSETTFHLNKNGRWDLENPDQKFLDEDAWISYQFADLDADGLPELIQARIPMTVLEIIELLVQEAIDIEISVFVPDAETVYAVPAAHKSKLDLGIRLDIFEPRGFVPTLSADFNGDGLPDRISSGDGKAIEIYLGGGKKPFATRDLRQELDTNGSLRLGDLDGDGLTDFLIFDRTRPDAPIRIGINRGTLPGTIVTPSLTAPNQ